MKRSSFLWITGIGVALLGVALKLRRQPDLRSERHAAGLERYSASLGRPGRCQATRRTSRWAGYTIDELAA